ncbi:hypothetical protein CRE_21898 [Caenorhabditis remanei]|uniref:Uncharacterized protein n=1 Tax=Caenorhabditis remanei TaxID=31234 RepID=E3MU78_CAERE|nr:hypothetical protein CRE_21898 [Caenorhabditis remanei]
MEEMQNEQPQNPLTKDEKKALHTLVEMCETMKKTVKSYQNTADLIIERVLEFATYDPPEEHIADLTLIEESLEPKLQILEKAAKCLKGLQTLIQPERLHENMYIADLAQDDVTCYLAKTSKLHIPSSPDYSFITTHIQFKEMYGLFKKSLKNAGVTTKVLYENASGLVIEFKIMVTQPSEFGMDACLLKFLVVEKYGVVEWINFIGPEEEWDIENNYNVKKVIKTSNFYTNYIFFKVVPFKASRYEVYKRMTANAITHLDGFTPIWTQDRFNELFSFLFKYGDVFKQKCRICGRILSALMVPTFDRNEETPRHESCPKAY